MVPVTPTREALGVSHESCRAPYGKQSRDWVVGSFVKGPHYQGLAACDPAGRPRDDGADAQERGLMSPPKWHDRDVTMLDDEYTYVCVVRV